MNFRSLTRFPPVPRDEVYWALPAISGPLIFLTQVANVLSFGFDKLMKICVAVSGHSQGLGVAFVLSLSKSEEELILHSWCVLFSFFCLAPSSLVIRKNPDGENFIPFNFVSYLKPYGQNSILDGHLR